ncbi:hypothetical protein CHS0354_007501 [Potamilus streckersoni]|uniref:Protein FAM114A2 n=1 Tax=Potamilus streckersoni TaxID=2493646 RepID=A0AAE0T7S3_9BIVA|nr:hypothetical protein CHS0354_007501 [Potamilus streckersoni]
MSGTDDDAFASADEGDEDLLTLKQKDKDEGSVSSNAANSQRKKSKEESVKHKPKTGEDTSRSVTSSTKSVADGVLKHPSHQTKKSKQKTKKGKIVVKSKENEGDVFKENEKVKYSEMKQIKSESLDLSSNTSKPSFTEDEKSEQKLQEVTEIENVQNSHQTAEKGSTEMKTPQKDITVETELITQECTATKDLCTAEETSRKTELLKSPSSQEIVRPMQDSPNEQDSDEKKDAGQSEPTKSSSSGGWGWGSWGSSLLDMASSSVTTFTSQVGGGLNAVLETVESTLNIPPPEQFVDESAKKEKDEKTNSNDDDTQDKSEEKEAITTKPKESDSESVEQPKSTSKAQEPQQMQAASKASGGGGGGWFSSWGVSSITGIVQNTSKSLVTGGLDVLETIGKKTFDVIKDHDPGLKKARGFLFERKDKPNLSQILRDAKKEAEFRVEKEKEFEESRKADFGVHFDEFQGLVHLEALEILSQQSERKVQSLLTALPTDSLTTIKPTLLLIKQTFETEIEEESEDEEGSQKQDFNRLVAEHLAELQIGSMPNKVKQTWEEIEVWLKQFHEKKDSDTSSKIIHQIAIQSLARLTSKGIDQFHKTGELILLHMDADHDYAKKSQSLASLTKILCKEMGCLANKFADCLTSVSEEDRGNEIGCLTTNIYLEASNSSSYVQDGFRLLLPVLQQAAIETSEILNR